MESNIKTAIDALVGSINKDTKGDEALKLSQAALNLAHTAGVINQTAQAK